MQTEQKQGWNYRHYPAIRQKEKKAWIKELESENLFYIKGEIVGSPLNESWDCIASSGLIVG